MDNTLQTERGQLLSIRAAADILDLTVPGVHWLIKQKKLTATRELGFWLVVRDNNFEQIKKGNMK